MSTGFERKPALAEPERHRPDAEIILDPKIQAALGRSLKAHYDDLVSAPVPDRFLALLAELDATEQRQQQARDGGLPEPREPRHDR